MKLGSLLVTAILAASSAGAWGQDKPRADSTPVDSSSFGIFLNGKRIGTEKFTIVQQAEAGVLTAELKVDDGTTRYDQHSEMRVGRDGSLQSYQWRSTLPAQQASVVEPKDALLIEHFTDADRKKRDFRYLLPLTTAILDDNFFSQRELLIWRYLSTGCRPNKDNLLACGPAHFATLVPHQHLSGSAVVELLGRDKIAIKGIERELNQVQIEADGVKWLLWVDDPENHYKVIRMTLPASNVEVVRE